MARDDRPLDGQVVWVTGARKGDALARILERFGARPVVVPTLDTRPLDDDEPAQRAVRALAERHIAVAVFLTGTGVRMLLAAAESAGLAEDVTAALNGGVVVARGPKARSALRGAGVRVDMEPAEPTAQGILAALAGARFHGRDVLVQLHGRRDATLCEGLESRGARVLEVPLYRYAPALDEGRIIDWIGRTARGEVYAITFTSPPAVLGLFAAADRVSLADLSTAALTRAVIAAVGPTTGDTLEELGVRPDVVPTTYTQPALVEALAAYARGVGGAASRPSLPLDRAVKEIPLRNPDAVHQRKCDA